MIDFSSSVTGDESVKQYLTRVVPKITEGLKLSMDQVVVRLTRYVKEQKLSGQILKNRTGTLRRKINGRVAVTSAAVTGTTGVKLAYAAAHEYGMDGIVTVREHLRTIKQAFGRPLAEAKQVYVRSHPMHMKLPERSFLRSSLRELTPEILQMLDQAVSGAVS